MSGLWHGKSNPTLDYECGYVLLWLSIWRCHYDQVSSLPISTVKPADYLAQTAKAKKPKSGERKKAPEASEAPKAAE